MLNWDSCNGKDVFYGCYGDYWIDFRFSFAGSSFSSKRILWDAPSRSSYCPSRSDHKNAPSPAAPNNNAIGTKYRKVIIDGPWESALAWSSWSLRSAQYRSSLLAIR